MRNKTQNMKLASRLARQFPLNSSESAAGAADSLIVGPMRKRARAYFVLNRSGAAPFQA